MLIIIIDYNSWTFLYGLIRFKLGHIKSEILNCKLPMLKKNLKLKYTTSWCFLLYRKCPATTGWSNEYPTPVPCYLGSTAMWSMTVMKPVTWREDNTFYCVLTALPLCGWGLHWQQHQPPPPHPHRPGLPDRIPLRHTPTRAPGPRQLRLHRSKCIWSIWKGCLFDSFQNDLSLYCARLVVIQWILINTGLTLVVWHM